MNPWKLRLAALQTRTGVDRLMLGAQKLVSPYIRAVNYHGVPERDRGALLTQLRWYKERFVPVGVTELAELLDGKWQHDRPGLLLSFDDGLRSVYDVAAPAAEEVGFPLWTFVPVGFIDCAASTQREFAALNQIELGDVSAGDRVAMSWDELRDLDRRGHVVGAHTYSHRRLRATVTDAELEREVVETKRRLETELGHAVSSFCWVGGEEWSYSAVAAARIRAAGYRYSFMTNHQAIRPTSNRLQLQRTHIEADFPLPLVRFHLSGAMDLLYTRKRRNVVRLTR